MALLLCANCASHRYVAPSAAEHARCNHEHRSGRLKMIDRLVHHAEILALKGDSYRLKDRDLARPPGARSPETA